MSATLKSKLLLQLCLGTTSLTDLDELNPAEEAARAAQEKAEQDALPYKWTQTIGELDLTFSVPGNYKSKDLKIDLQKTKIVTGVKGQEPLITVRPPLSPLPSLLFPSAPVFHPPLTPFRATYSPQSAWTTAPGP